MRAVKGGWRWQHGTFPWRLDDKVHALVDAEERPIRISLTPGQAHNTTAAEELLADLKSGATLLAGKAYDSRAVRKQTKDHDVWANIPPKSTRKGSVVFCASLYRYINLAERFFNKLKRFRGIATRHDKTPENFLAGMRLASAGV